MYDKMDLTIKQTTEATREINFSTDGSDAEWVENFRFLDLLP
jgi:hypothetical protein